jgi:phosphate transport system substrate-binding protein
VSRIHTVAVGTAVAVLASAGIATAKSSITMSGSTSVYPLAQQLINKYKQVYPSRATFRVSQGGSDVGVSDVAAGRVTIGASSREPLSSDPKGLTFTPIARDGICIVTNPSNPIGNLSQSQVQAIFSGRTRSWNQVPGAKASGAIDILTRTASSGTADAFQNIFMGTSLHVAASAQAKTSNGLVQQAVRSDKNAIGFVSFDFVAGTHAAAYQGVACTLRNAGSGQYGGVRRFFLVTKGAPTGAAKDWINWVRTNAAARKIIASDWIPLS